MHIAGTGERSPFNYSKTAQIDNNTVQRNAHRLGEIRKHVCYTSPKLIDQRRREIGLSFGNGQCKRTNKDSKLEAWRNWLKDSLGMTEIRVWPEQTCCERVHRIQLLEESGILRECEQKLRCVAVNGRSRHASGVRDVHSQQTTDIARTDENWENWDMEASINNFQQWLKRHKVDDVPGNSGGVRPKREKPWFKREKGPCLYLL